MVLGGEGVCLAAELTGEQVIHIAGPGVSLTFTSANNRLALTQIQRADDAPLLYEDKGATQPGASPSGNLLAIVIREGRFASTVGVTCDFKLSKSSRLQVSLHSN